jgi:hypothetical protein
MKTHFKHTLDEAKANYLVKTLNQLYPKGKWVISCTIDKIVFFDSNEPHMSSVCYHLYDDTVKIKHPYQNIRRVQYITWQNGQQEAYYKIDFANDNDVREAMIAAVGIDSSVTI